MVVKPQKTKFQLKIVENIFDFWLDTFKDQEAWEACLGLLKVRKRIPLKNLIETTFPLLQVLF